MPTELTDDKKVLKALEKIKKIINKSNLNVPELIVLCGNLTYQIGASIAGFKATGPALEELKREYYTNPTIDTGLMLQGLLINDWEKDYQSKPVLSRFAKDNKIK